MATRVPGFVLLSFVLTGCVRAAASTVPEPVAARILAVAPVMESSASFEGAAVGRALSDGLTRGTRVELAHEAEAVEPDCLGSSSCLRDLGVARDVDFVATCTVVTLGDTAVVRVRLVPVAGGGTEQVRQTVVSAADPATLEGAVRALGEELATPFAIPRDDGSTAARRRRRRWLGPVIAVVAAGAAATAIVIARDREPEPDVVIRPP